MLAVSGPQAQTWDKLNLVTLGETHTPLYLTTLIRRKRTSHQIPTSPIDSFIPKAGALHHRARQVYRHRLSRTRSRKTLNTTKSFCTPVSL